MNLRSILHFTTLGLIILVGSACQKWSESKVENSVLVVAVEILPQEAVLCSESPSEEGSGFQDLCKESVRFTHAFTPSVMSQSALASILTGQWPHQHGVRHNGSQYLSAPVETVTEKFLKKRFRTSFFSGGPPIWHKSGLGQGFEWFEDAVPVSREQLHRPFHDLSNAFLNWLDRDSAPFFLVMYAPDLQVFDLPSMDRSGHPTDRSYEGQLREFDRTLGDLISNLKRQNLWNGMYFVLVGLNGRSRAERVNELGGYNLHLENTQVVLMVKPPQAVRDEAMNWKIDSNVSLVDLGRTLIQISGGETPADAKLKSNSLLGSLTAPKENWDKDRFILIESAWPQWHGFGPIRYALRASNSLYLMNRRVDLYSTLSDRLETSPQAADSRLFQLESNLSPELRLNPWYMKDSPSGLIDVAINLWDPSSSAGVVEVEFQKDKRILGWLALKALKEKNWKSLFDLSRMSKNKEWEYLALSAQGKKASPPEDDCFLLFQEKTSPARDDLYKSCDDQVAKILSQLGSGDQSGSDVNSLKEALLRYYEQISLDRRISQLNLVNGMNWDVAVDKYLYPTTGEIILHLPGNEKYLGLVEERFAQAQNL